MSASTPKTVGEIDAFITMLRVACDDKNVYARLERILSMPDQKRQALVHTWINDMLIGQAPKNLIQAIACLLNDDVAEKAYEVIFKCSRGERI
jgi:hypothetical protein